MKRIRLLYRLSCFLHKAGTCQAAVKSFQVQLGVSDNLDPDSYLDGNGVPTRPGIKAIMNTMIQGLVTNILIGHQNGHWKKEEHLAFVKKEIQRAYDNLENVRMRDRGPANNQNENLYGK